MTPVSRKLALFRAWFKWRHFWVTLLQPQTARPSWGARRLEADCDPCLNHAVRRVDIELLAVKSTEDLRHIYRDDANGLVTWRVEVCRGRVRAKRQFSAAKHGDEHAALQAAKVWRDTTLAQLDAVHAQTASSASSVPGSTGRRSLAGALALPHPSLLAMHGSSQAAGVTCLDTTWQGSQHHYRFRCDHGHESSRSVSAQRRRPDCPVCTRERSRQASLKTDNLSWFMAYAQFRGGRCLSTVYLGAKASYHLRCAQGHEWQTPGTSLYAGKWCGVCAIAAMKGRPLSESAHRQARLAKLLPDGLERLQAMAQKRGGQCLAPEYLGTGLKHRFRCAESHEWEAVGSSILNGVWCAQCSKVARSLTINHAHKAARARGGRCLSTTYVNAASPLTWECDRGHGWRAALGSIRIAGTWCPECAHFARITNRKSKARKRYADGGKHLVSE